MRRTEGQLYGPVLPNNQPYKNTLSNGFPLVQRLEPMILTSLPDVAKATRKLGIIFRVARMTLVEYVLLYPENRTPAARPR